MREKSFLRAVLEQIRDDPAGFVLMVTVGPFLLWVLFSLPGLLRGW